MYRDASLIFFLFAHLGFEQVGGASEPPVCTTAHAAGRQTGRQAGRQAGGQAGRQAGRQAGSILEISASLKKTRFKKNTYLEPKSLRAV